MTVEIRMRAIGLALCLLLALPAGTRAAPGAVVELDVQGMSCNACSYRVQKALSGLEGAQAAEVSLERKKARIVFAPGAKPDLGLIEKVIRDSGFTPGKPALSTQNAR